MADALVSPSPSASWAGALPMPKDPTSKGGPLADVSARVSKFDTAEGAAVDRLHAVATDTRARLEREEAGAAGLRPPELQQVPPPTIKNTTPQEEWGSAAMMFAVIGGLFSRQHLTTALNAAAGVLNAYKKGDQEAANMAYQTWKVANDNALKMANYQQKVYDDILSNLTRREGVIVQEGGMEERAAAAELLAHTHALRDAVAAGAIMNGGLNAFTKLQYDRARAIERMQGASTTLGKKQAENQVFQDWLVANPNATPDETLAKIAEIQGEGSPAGKAREMRAAADKEGLGIKLDALQNETIHALAILKSDPSVVGVPGMARLVGEIVAPWIGMGDAGTDAHAYNDIMGLIRTGATSQALGPGMRNNVKFAANVENLAQYIGPGQNRETQAKALMLLSNYINQLNNRPILFPEAEALPGVSKSLDERAPAEVVPGARVSPIAGKSVVGIGIPSPVPAGQPGSTADNPLHPKTQGDFRRLPRGVWFAAPMDGGVYQKRD